MVALDSPCSWFQVTFISCQTIKKAPNFQGPNFMNWSFANFHGSIWLPIVLPQWVGAQLHRAIYYAAQSLGLSTEGASFLNGFLHPVHPMALMLPENGWCQVPLLFFYKKPSVRTVSENSVWKVFTPCAPTCTALCNIIIYYCTPVNTAVYKSASWIWGNAKEDSESPTISSHHNTIYIAQGVILHTWCVLKDSNGRWWISR